ncbi:hypothetical protein BJX70DRAFT_382555 [Aspergillus crustosus]
MYMNKPTWLPTNASSSTQPALLVPLVLVTMLGWLSVKISRLVSFGLSSFCHITQ